MKAVPLFNICRPKQWKTIASKDLVEEGYPVYGANGKIGFYHEYNHEKPTILITCRGATCGTVNISEPYAYINGNAMALDGMDESKSDINYVARYLSYRGFEDVISGSAQPQITRDGLKNLTLPLPSLPEQRRIAAILDKADALRAKRREAIAKLDQLLQSVFLDMFGDPVTNPKGWPDTTRLGETTDICSGITKGRKASSETREVPYLAVANVQDRHLKLGTIKTIGATEQEINRYRLLANDLLLTEGGDPDKLGRGALWDGSVSDCIHQNHVFRVRITSNAINPVFLNWLVGSARGKRYFLGVAKQTTGIASINMTQLKSFPLLTPPIDLQERFAALASRIETHRETINSAENSAGDLFRSLQQQAFERNL